MRLTFRATLAVAAVAMLAGCSMFGGKKGPTAEEREGRVPMSLMEQKLKPDATLAATTVALPAAVPAVDSPQAGVTASKSPGNRTAGDALQVDWRASVGAGSNLTRRMVAPPVVAGGKLFAMDADQRVTAFNADTGAKLWSVKLQAAHKKDKHAVGGGLAVAGDKLIVSSGFGYVAALSVADGAELWKRKTESPMSGAPAILGARAYVTSTNNELYAIDVANGEVLWTDQAIAESARVLSAPSPAVQGEILAAPFTSGEIIAYLPANGRRLWSDTLTTAGRFTPLSAINDIAGRPTIENGVVYASSHSGVTTAIDARSGQRSWAMLFGSRLGPVLAGDYLFLVGTNGEVACLDKVKGGVVWVRSLPEFAKPKNKKERIVWTGPLVASNRLIVVSSKGNLLALSPQTGETVGEMKLGSPVYIEPIAADGKIYVLTDKAQLIAIR